MEALNSVELGRACLVRGVVSGECGLAGFGEVTDGLLVTPGEAGGRLKCKGIAVVFTVGAVDAGGVVAGAASCVWASDSGRCDLKCIGEGEMVRLRCAPAISTSP